MEIIIKKKKTGNVFPKRGDKVTIISRQGPISKENRGEWRNEKRVKELAKKGYGVGNIAAMMFTKDNNIRERHVEKMLKHKIVNKRDMVLDGQL